MASCLNTLILDSYPVGIYQIKRGVVGYPRQSWLDLLEQDQRAAIYPGIYDYRHIYGQLNLDDFLVVVAKIFEIRSALGLPNDPQVQSAVIMADGPAAEQSAATLGSWLNYPGLVMCHNASDAWGRVCPGHICPSQIQKFLKPYR